LLACYLDPRFKSLNSFPEDPELRKIPQDLLRSMCVLEEIKRPESPKKPRLAVLLQPPQQPVSEQVRYHLLPEIPFDDASNPLSWWKEHEKEFPQISVIAKNLLAVPATSVPAERLFSKAGRVVTKARAALGGSFAAKIIFLNSNIDLVRNLLFK